jgi:hypothetical protein
VPSAPKGGTYRYCQRGYGNPEDQSNIYRGLEPLQVTLNIVNANGKHKYSLRKLRHFAASNRIEQNFSAKKILVGSCFSPNDPPTGI